MDRYLLPADLAQPRFVTHRLIAPVPARRTLLDALKYFAHYVEDMAGIEVGGLRWCGLLDTAARLSSRPKAEEEMGL